jgi:hypothetical protein
MRFRGRLQAFITCEKVYNSKATVIEINKFSESCQNSRRQISWFPKGNNFLSTLFCIIYTVYIIARSVHSIKKNAEDLIIASKEIGLEVNAEKTKYMVMSRNQNAGHNRNINIDNKSFERVEEFRYLGATVTNRNSIHEEIKSRLKSGNACYHSVQNLLSSRLLSKNTKMRV